MFTVRKKDGLARIGVLTTRHGKISTPALLPVINPNRQIIHPEEMAKYGTEAFITNAYLLYKNPENREQVLQEGLHKYIDFSGPLMTDSGAFQLMEYGEVSINNRDITSFQEKIGSDIGVFLDIPIKEGTYEESRLALKETLNRADENIKCRNSVDSILWAGPIQGGRYLDLIEKSCLEMAKKEFAIHPIGSVVPLLEKYDFETVVKMILTAKRYLPLNRPIHLFGAGHPMFFAVAIFLGIDIFDSASYILYAKKNRYLTTSGTMYLDTLQYLPCSCKVCQNYTATELKQLDQDLRTSLIAKHNLIVSLKEISNIKQAIIEGRLYELVLTRIMNHPSLARLIDLLFGFSTSQFIEKYEVISKPRALLITHPILSFQPILLRYRDRVLQRFYSWNSTLLIAQDFQNIHSTGSYQVIKLSPLFGVIPDELRGIFPLIQHERIPLQFSQEIIDYIKKFLEKHKSKFTNIEIHPSIKLDVEFLKDFKVFEGIRAKSKLNEAHIVNSILDFQFGIDTHKIVDFQLLKIERSRKTGIIRRFSDSSGVIGTFRASDFQIIPTKEFALRLHQHIPSPYLRVVVASECIPFVVKNKDVLAKFVLDVDSNIRSGEEVLVVDENDNFLNYGKAILAPPEMIALNRGVAVHIRR